MRFAHFLILLTLAWLPAAARAQTADDSGDARPDPNVIRDALKSVDVRASADARDNEQKDADSDDNDAKDDKPQAGEVKKSEARKRDMRRAAESLRDAADGKKPDGSRQPNGGTLLDLMRANEATVKGAWIGISTSPAAPALRKQLKLPDGTGLVVDFVEPRSPAQEADLKQYDLLEKLNDQLLINAEQFAVLVRTFKPGEEVKLTLVREGKRQEVRVKLGEHEVPRVLLNFQVTPFQPMAPRPAPGMAPVPPSYPGFGGANPAGPALSTPPESSLTWLDGKRAITLTTRDGHSLLTASDGPSGKVLYATPVDTQEQRAKLPRDIRDRLSLLKLPEFSRQELAEPGAQGNSVPATPQDPKAPELRR